MIKRDGAPAVYERDPYDHEERDPQKCHGMALTTCCLSSNFCRITPSLKLPIVQNLYRTPLAKWKKDLNETLYYSWDDVYQNTMKDKKPIIPEQYVRPDPVPPLYPIFLMNFETSDNGDKAEY